MLYAKLANHFNRCSLKSPKTLQDPTDVWAELRTTPQILRVAKLGVYTSTYGMAE